MALNLGPLNVMLRLQGAQQFTRDARSASGSIDKLSGAAKGLATAYLSVAGAQKALQLASDAAAFEDASRIFRLAGGNLDELRKSVRGTVSDFELIKKANLARIMGIPSDAMGTLAQAAIAASKATGESVDFMLDSIVRGVARGSPLILDNLGIIISIEEASATYAKTLGKNADELTKAEKAQAVLNATLKAVGPQIEAANKANADSAEIYRQTEAQVQNLSIQMGQSLMPALAAILPLAIDVAKYLGFIFTGTTPEFEAVKAAEKMADKSARLSSQLKKAEEQARQLQQALTEGYGEELARQWDPTLTALEAALKLQKQIIGLRAKLKKMGPASPPVAPLGEQPKTATGGGPSVKVTATVVDISGVGGGVPLFNDRLFGDAISPLKRSAEEVEEAQKGLAEAAAKAADRFEQAGAIIHQIGSALVSGNVGATFGPQLLGAVGSAISMKLGDPTGAIGGAIGSLLGQIFGSAFDELVNALGVLAPLFEIVGDILKAFSAPLIVLRTIFEALRDVIAIGVVPMAEIFAGLFAKALYGVLIIFQTLAPWLGVLLNVVVALSMFFYPLMDLILSPMLLLAEAFAKLAVGSINLYNAFADFVNGLVTALREIEILGAKPFESFGALMTKLDPTTVQTYLDLIADENEARSEAAEGLREFSEELRNVPIGVKRIRALQFSAAAGRFNSPAWGA